MIELTVDCLPMQAKLTERSCEINQSMALSAAQQLHDHRKKKAILLLDDTELDRLGACGKCTKNAIKGLDKVFLRALISGINVLVDQIEVRDYDTDPELQRKKALNRWQEYNSRPEVKARRKARNLARRLKQFTPGMLPGSL